MRLLLETTPLHGPGSGRGLGRYVRELMAALQSQGELDVFEVPVGDHRLGELVALPRRQHILRHRNHGLLYAPTPLHVPLRSRAPWVASILDTIPLDVTSHRQTGAKTQLFFRLAARADAVLTLSQDAADRIAARLGVPRERIVVAPIPCPVIPQERMPVRRFSALPEGPYVVGMADLAAPDPRKRIPWFAAVGEQLAAIGVTLVLVGPDSDGPRAPRHTIGLGRLDDDDWSSVLSHAAAFVYCSAFEGQGLPPLEAMAHSVPVVAMGNTAVTEVVGDAGILVRESQPAGLAAAEPHSSLDAGAQALARAVLALMVDPERRARLAVAAYARAQTFTTIRFRSGVERAGSIALASRKKH